MASIQERIERLGDTFVGFNIGSDGNGNQFIYLETTFPPGWGITSIAKDKFGVQITKNDTGTGYYFWAPMSVGFDSVFDAVELTIKANKEAQEKEAFLKEKIGELQKIVLEEDMATLRTLEFKIKRKKATPKKKVEEPQTEEEITEKSEE